MRILTLLFFISFLSQVNAATISGQLQNNDGTAVDYANVALYSAADSSLYKVEVSDENGNFKLQGLKAGSYYLVASFVGLDDLTKKDIQLAAEEDLQLGVLQFGAASIELGEAMVTAKRSIVEVKSDRTVFNVEGTINSVGTDALSLMRKAPSVTVDNNDNITVLGRAGVLLYVDGKRLPLSGEDLSNYLRNIPAEQIDRIDIITNPGARYEAEGNAGIIDIRLKRNKEHGANGTVNGSYSKGRYERYNLGVSGNYRNKLMNVFGNVGFGEQKTYHDIIFTGAQNGIQLDEINDSTNDRDNTNYRIGSDFFIADKHTIGFMVSGNQAIQKEENKNRIAIGAAEIEPLVYDSILVADNLGNGTRDQSQYNLNYRYNDRKTDRTLNLDLDFGRFENESERSQPNTYFDPTETSILTKNDNAIETPTKIDIYTFKLDHEQKFLGGKLGLGSKLSRVESDNTFLFFDVNGDVLQQDDQRSNIFDYNENVYAAYVTYSGAFHPSWSYTAGLRFEQTDADGQLQVFDESLSEDPFNLNYPEWFPSAGLTWQVKPMHTLALNYGRRINRPDYNVLNPFESQLSEISLMKGNPFLNPEIVNNIELGYTMNYMYNLKIGYSRTANQITRIIGPDEEDDKTNFIEWRNLDDQTVISGNLSVPVQIKKWWSAFFNLSGSYIDNQSDYGDGATVDLQVFSYTIFQQHTFTLPAGFTGEISGYYSGPGIWGGVFKYENSWSLDIGLQKRFLNEKLNVKLSASDLFFESGWNGVSEFNGLRSEGSGTWDSRRVTLSATYNFGNQNVKSRKRKTGIEDEAGRVGG